MTFGTCRYCGQVVNLDYEEETQAEADIAASEKCECYDARHERNLRKQITAAQNRIRKIFGDDAAKLGFSPIAAEEPPQLLNASVSAHTHSVSAHTHTVKAHTHTVQDHTHKIEFGIYEGARASSATIKVDGVEIPAPASYDNLDIVEYLKTDGSGKIQRNAWHTIQILPNSMSRIVGAVFMQTFCNSRGGGDY